MRWIASLVTMALWAAGLLAGELPKPLPASSAVESREAQPPLDVSRLEHLHKAIKHLQSAGLEAEADRLRHVAAELEDEATRRLDQLRAHREDLLREIRELERLTGQHEQIALECRILECTRDQLLTLGIAWPSTEQTEPQTLDERFFERPQLMNADAVQTLFDQLRKQGLVKELAHPSIVTTNGQPATLMSGGEFPIILPVSGDSDTVDVEWREFGTRLEAVCHTLGGNRVRVEVTSELTQRDFRESVTLGGLTIPGINARRLNLQTEMAFGQTQVAGITSTPSPPSPILSNLSYLEGLFTPADSVPEQVTLFLITPRVVSARDGEAPAQ